MLFYSVIPILLLQECVLLLVLVKIRIASGASISIFDEKSAQSLSYSANKNDSVAEDESQFRRFIPHFEDFGSELVENEMGLKAATDFMPEEEVGGEEDRGKDNNNNVCRRCGGQDDYDDLCGAGIPAAFIRPQNHSALNKYLDSRVRNGPHGTTAGVAPPAELSIGFLTHMQYPQILGAVALAVEAVNNNNTILPHTTLKFRFERLTREFMC